MLRTLRTPDERFEGLDEYPFDPHYVDVYDDQGEPIRMHYLDEGERTAAPVLLLHGEPAWSYLYRRIIPLMTGAGHRCIVPDLIRFGRSDKLVERADHSYARHVAWMRGLVIDQLKLDEITLFAQDWGGLIGLRLLAAHPDRFARVAISNTGLPTGEEPVNVAFLEWQRFSQEAKHFPVGTIVSSGCATPLTPNIIRAYDAPFLDESFKVGPRVMPSLVPTHPDDPAHDDNVVAWRVLRSFDRPFLCLFSDLDPLTAGGADRFIAEVPGAQSQCHRTIEGAGHFVQEDAGPKLAQILMNFVEQ